MVPPSILMHASLAYLSPEFQTFAFIIRHHSNNTLLIHPESVNSLHAMSSTTLSSLPPEILLTIQYHLLPDLISHLSTLSDHTLASYESSIFSLLCTDCQEYNKKVYGPTFWDWPHFFGPCRCESVGKNCETSFAEPISQQINTDLHPNQFGSKPICRNGSSPRDFGSAPPCTKARQLYGTLWLTSCTILDPGFVMVMELLFCAPPISMEGTCLSFLCVAVMRGWKILKNGGRSRQKQWQSWNAFTVILGYDSSTMTLM